MAIFSFKNVGKTREERVIEQFTASSTPIGIKTPLSEGADGNIFQVTYNLADQVHDNLRNLILTNWGERVGLYDYGANLGPLMSELVSPEDFDAAAVEHINNAVNRWMAYISLETFESSNDQINNKNTSIKLITIVYNIPSLNVLKKALRVTLYAI